MAKKLDKRTLRREGKGFSSLMEKNVGKKELKIE